MSDIVLYGATGYTGTRVARCLARRGASFSVAGRNRDALEAVGRETGAVAAHVVESGDAGALARACGGAAVLVSCVGPFVEHGGTAVEAALQARVHYVDSTGEASFVRRLIVDHGAPAATAGIAMVPAMGFDEVPADVAASLAAGDMGGAELRLTYALPSGASSGTIMSALGILGTRAIFLRAGREVEVPTGGQRR
ncbi:MAG: saccharopine dehydrogenase NADP-binding domain-containing protein, partial [Actinobacteria bacterium]|nr:saccharopine dehydrogenase NADP-binding domain-containing protein [Actinomycetota bacterium]